MKNSKPISIAPYIDIIFRHRLSALSIFIVGVSVTISLVAMLQDVYRSTAVIVIQPAQVASSYVNLDASKTHESPSVADQLEALAYKAFSRERREQLIRKFGLYGYRPGKPMEPRLALMESKIDLVVPQDAIVYETERPGARAPDILKISFEYVDRVIAQQVTQDLSEIYVEEGYRERIQRAHDATGFLAKQTAEVRGRLDTADGQIKELEQRYQGSLPQELESNFREGEIGRLQDQLNLINQQIVSTHAIPTVSAQGIASSPEQALMMLNLKLNQLRSEFSDEYPDVVQLKQQIADLKLQIKSEPRDAAAKSSSEFEVSPGQSRLNQEAGTISTQLETLKRRVALTPVHGQELATLQRDYDALATDYHGLLNKELAAQLNEDLEKRHQDERLQVLQPATMARRPVSPNRIAIGILGICFSTFAALALPFGLYFTDTSFKDPEELQSEFSIPVVAILPIVGAAKEARIATIRALGASFIGILGTTIAIWAYTRHLL